MSNEFISIFNSVLLPRGVRVGKEDRSLNHLRHILVSGELRSVVSRDGSHIFSIREEPSDNHFSGLQCVFAVLKALHKDEVSLPFRKGDNRPFIVFPDDGVKLPVSKSGTVRLLRTFVDTPSVGDIPATGNRTNGTFAMFEFVPAMGI